MEAMARHAAQTTVPPTRITGTPRTQKIALNAFRKIGGKNIRKMAVTNTAQIMLIVFIFFDNVASPGDD